MVSRFAGQAPRADSGAPITTRLDHAVEFLNQHGYVARWERAPQGFLLYARNCPFEAVAHNHAELCGIDSALITNLLGCSPQCTGHMNDGAEACSFFIRHSEAPAG